MTVKTGMFRGHEFYVSEILPEIERIVQQSGDDEANDFLLGIIVSAHSGLSWRVGSVRADAFVRMSLDASAKAPREVPA